MSHKQVLNNGLISTGQMGKMLVLFALGSGALILPTIVAVVAKEDSWLTMLMAWLLNYLFLFAPLALTKRFPNQSVIVYAQRVLGRWGGIAYSLIYILFFLILSALVLRNMGDFIGTAVLPETPHWFIYVTFMMVIVYGVMLGIEVIGRTSELLFLWVLLVIGVIFILLINKMDFNNLRPILAHGWSQPIKGLYPLLGFPLGEYSFVMILFPLVRPEDRKKLTRAMWLSSAVIGLVGVWIAVILLAVLGVELTTHSPFAVYDMAKQISVGNVLERVEITVAVIWISTIFSKLILCFYVLNVATAQLLRFTTYRPLVLPMAFIVIPLAMLVFRNSAQVASFGLKVWSIPSVFQGLLMPLFLLAIAAMRGITDKSVSQTAPVNNLQNNQNGSESQSEDVQEESNKASSSPS